jgi:hypothetical protein
MATANFDAKFWNSLNIFSKALMIIGLSFVDLAMLLSGLKEKNE